MERTIRLRTRDGLTLDVSIPKGYVDTVVRMLNRRFVYGQPMKELPYNDNEKITRHYRTTGLFVVVEDGTIEIFEEE